MFVFGFFVPSPTYATNSIQLSLTGLTNNTLTLGLVPKSTSGTFAKSTNLGIGVALSGVGGYTLSIKAGTTGANATSLIHTSDSSKMFTSINSAVSESDFANSANTQYNNTWGYLPSKYDSISNTSFRPAPDESGDILDYTETDNATNNYTLAIGARADLNTTVGSYENTFVITAVANLGCNEVATSINNALCMQDINDSVISSMEEERQYQLKDNRDWKQYYVAKMKDGKVWMTQNLDLDLEITPTNVAALTSENTDLNTAYSTDGNTLLPGYSVDGTTNVITFTPSVATTNQTGTGTWNTSTSAGVNNANTLPQSFDYGERYNYVYTSGNTNNYNSKSACETDHPDGTCPHFHVGNYYDWTAAVAMNNTNSTSYGGADDNYYNASSFSAPNSICPAGWQLPEGRTTTTTTSLGYYGDYNIVLKAQGIIDNYVTSSSGVYATNGWINVRNNPLYFTGGGYKTSVNNPSNSGSPIFWTSTRSGGSYYYAYNIQLNNSYINLMTTSSRHYGLPIRCVATPASNTGVTTVTFNNNESTTTGIASGTTGVNNTAIYNANTINSLPSNGFSIPGYVFNSWNTESDGSGKSYSDASLLYAKAGNESTNITLYAIWDKVYTITFNVGANASSISFGGTIYTNGQTTQAIDGNSYVVGGNYPTKYAFNSWSATAGSFENSSAAATNYTVTSDATITLTGQEATTDITTLTNSSDPIPSTCKNDSATPELVYDSRDNEAYWVARLCDGKYWMLDNLRLDLTDSAVINALSTSNTNIDATTLNYFKNGGGTTSDQYPTTGLISGSRYGYSVPSVKNNYKNEITAVVYGVGSGKMGVYYNYCAVSAGSYCWGDGNRDTGSPTTDPKPNSYRDIDGDICPAGWHLPSDIGSGSDYVVLRSSYNSAIIGQQEAFQNALSLSLSGYYNSDTMESLGANGRFWTSTWSGTDMIYTQYSRVFGSSSIPSSTAWRFYSLSVRCVLDS